MFMCLLPMPLGRFMLKDIEDGIVSDTIKHLGAHPAKHGQIFNRLVHIVAAELHPFPQLPRQCHRLRPRHAFPLATTLPLHNGLLSSIHNGNHLYYIGITLVGLHPSFFSFFNPTISIHEANMRQMIGK